MGQDNSSEAEDFLQVAIDLPMSILIEASKAAKRLDCSTETFISSAIFAALVKTGQIEVVSCEECDEDGNAVAPASMN